MDIRNKIKTPPNSKKINIDDAIVIEEKNNKKDNNDDKINDESYLKNLNNQETVNLSESNKKDVTENVTIDFLNEEHIKNFTSSQTKEAEEVKESKFENKTTEELQNEIKKNEDDFSKKLTPKDLEEVAKFIIFLIDASLSSLMKWWSKDTSDTAYSLSKSKLDNLTYQLTLILVKYQTKFKIEFMFLISIVFLYAPAFIKAHENRKVNKNKNSNEVYDNNETATNNDTLFTDLVNKDVKKQTNTGVKRGKGNPGKI